MRARSVYLLTLVLLATLCVPSRLGAIGRHRNPGHRLRCERRRVPGVHVTITNASTGVVQTVVSGPNGAFEVRYLVPGEYMVQAASPASARNAGPSRFASGRWRG